MSKRVLPFFGGCAFSYLLTLNHTYETELVKKQLRTEIDTLKRMKDFEIDQVAQFRDPKKSAHSKDCNLTNIDEHYHYFWACTSNSLRERAFSFHLGASMRKVGSELLQQMPESVQQKFQ